MLRGGGRSTGRELVMEKKQRRTRCEEFVKEGKYVLLIRITLVFYSMIKLLLQKFERIVEGAMPIAQLQLATHHVENVYDKIASAQFKDVFLENI